MPGVDERYWLAITLASIFGTNLGDFYAHESGLGIVVGVALLAAIAAIVFAIERRDGRPREVYYWLVIIVIRTGATNVADYLSHGGRVPAVALALALTGTLILLAWWSTRVRSASGPSSAAGLPDTGVTYWLAMLTAGVFGTVVGDDCSHLFGQGIASIGLACVLAIVLLVWKLNAVTSLAFYWLIVAIARTTGTAVGDWLAENKFIGLGLPLSTLVTGLAFIAVIALWPRRASAMSA